MPMTYTSLTAAKGVSGSIANWISYTKLDIGPLLDEAQSLIFQYLRTREMKTSVRFTLAQYGASRAVPTDFLDPIGQMYCPSFNMSFDHKDDGFVQRNRNYAETSGTLATNPLTTTSGSSSVTVAATAHGFSQDSSIYLTGATAVGGLTITGTFEITSVATNSFVIDCTSVGTATSSATGGGAAVAYTCENLTVGSPKYWSIWDEKFRFDQAFSQQLTCELLYYKQPALLSSTNASNFLTTRYPNLVRVACQTSAADFMKDDAEYNKGLARLQAAIDRIQTQDDLIWRGATIDTETP